MSGQSPSRRLRTKTSEFTEFFRGAGHGSSQARQAQKEPSVNLEVPSSDTETSTKKKITRIQLFGRSRKKSNQSTASSPFLSSRESSDVGEPLNRAASSDRRPSVDPRPPIPPLPTVKTSSNSIGSKLAATFGHSRLPKPSVHKPITRPSTLSPTTSRAASYDSGSSKGSRPRSTTPRPAQPLITVSLSPDNLSDYKNLFTRPPQDADIASGPSPPPSSRLPKADSPIYPRRGQTPASAIAAAHRQATTGDDRSPSRSSRYSRKNSDSDKGHEETSRPSGTHEYPRLVGPDGEKEVSASVQRRPSVATGSVQYSENGNSSMRSRMKPPSSPARSRPPSIPLPQPPAHGAPPPEMPPSPLRQTFKVELEPATTKKMIVRPRAHTIGSVSNPSIPTMLSQPTIKPTATLSPPFTDIPEGIFDVETASAAELREALKIRNQQYDELATYVLKVTELHVAEVTNLEKKVSALDKEVFRQDAELKGLRWIMNHAKLSEPRSVSPEVPNDTPLSPNSTPSESDQDGSKTTPAASRRLNYQSDSGTESHAESVRSGASGSESVSSIRHRSLRKPSTLAEVTYNFCRTASSRRSSKWPPGLVAENPIPQMPTTHKRLSLSSVAPSPSSSTSSLLPPSPSITMSSLSAIPEGPSPLRYNSDQEERRALRASHRISTSSMTSSSTAASSAYSANMKRSRPPSIAQVLEKSPIMDDVLEKLRPFA
ncbi:hypothetical protein BYT27DRAFT_7187356 [Phlegmacium glaucopus]|nr:hypothetical protein BYT27DRAFT_7187356 [Phlegmacium glaucopus]